MKKNVKDDLKKMSLQDLKVRAAEIKKELFVLRMKKITNSDKNTALSRNLRKGLACTLTILRQKELHGG